MACRPMPPSEQPLVFISYTRKDGAALAERLQEDLNERGFGTGSTPNTLTPAFARSATGQYAISGLPDLSRTAALPSSEAFKEAMFRSKLGHETRTELPLADQ